MKNNINKFIFKSVAFLSMCSPVLVKGAQLPNPLNESNPVVIVANIIKAMLGILGGVSLIMFIYGGFILIFSTGNEERVKKGRGTLIWAIIGLAIALSSYSIMNYVFYVITDATS